MAWGPLKSRREGQEARGRLARPKPVSWLWILGALLASLGLGVLLLTELRAGPIIAAMGGLSLYFLLTFVLPKRLASSPAEDDVQALADVDDPRVDILVEAHQHLATLAAARPHVPDQVAADLDGLVQHGHVIVETVTAHPERLDRVLRVMTYYLPSAADLVSDRINLSTRAGPQRLEEIDATLGRLRAAFDAFEQAALAPDLEAVDLDVELLDQALKQDLPR